MEDLESSDSPASPPGAAPASADPVTAPVMADPPVVELTFPSLKTPDQPASEPASHPAARRPSRRWLIGSSLVLVVIVLGASYYIGKTRGRSAHAAAAAMAAAISPLEVPTGATLINTCSQGRGAQYVLPADQVHGPVFNVVSGKVVGLEFKISKADLAGSKSFFGLPLFGKRYDHLDIGLLPQADAYDSDSEYYIDVFNISRAAAASITCK